MLFDLSVRGHHPIYIRHLIKYWRDCPHSSAKGDRDLSGQLDIVVSPRFLVEHSDVVDFARSYDRDNIKFITITPAEEASLNSRKSRFKRVYRNFQEWKILCNYAKKLQASHCLVMYFDTCELPLTLGVKSPCSFSGIYFRPTFYYGELTNYQPSWKERFQQWRERLFLSRILRHPNLENLFCLDAFAVKHLDEFNTHVKAIPLPDPIEILTPSEFQVNNLKENLGIEANRKVLLLFGALTTRKGVNQLLDAIASLSPDLCQKICLMLVGESNIQKQIDSQIKVICQSKPIQIITRYEFVPEEEVQIYFHLADFVLAPYQRHVGMSGILLQAAAAQKPVLSSDYGLMGEIVRRYQLGLTVDSTIPTEISKGLTRLLVEDTEKLCDRDRMKSFAQENSAQQFASIIFQNIKQNGLTQ
ncbi:MAG: glycosyltransferase [Hydrococcus sp. CRU_1_1]|nr:glycosyltransferase [Hydrococcus sp. CRU_1_1]